MPLLDEHVPLLLSSVACQTQLNSALARPSALRPRMYSNRIPVSLPLDLTPVQSLFTHKTQLSHPDPYTTLSWRH